MAYLNPQLQSQTTDVILQLKEWLVDNSYKSTMKEKYGEDACGCIENKVIIAVKYIKMMQCYVFATDEVEEPYNCLSEEELITLIEKSIGIINSNC